MTLHEAKTLFKKHAAETIESWGFKEKKVRRAETIYIRTKENGFEEFGINPRNYMPIVVYGIGATKRLNLIEDILSAINTKYSWNLDLDKETFTVGCRKNKRELDIALPSVEDEQGVIESSKILLDYIGNTILPMFDLFDDIREIDKRINGEGENYWESDSDARLPFSLGHIFSVRRWIIAKLSKTEKGFQNFCNKHFEEIDKNYAKKNKPKFDRNDKSNWLNQTISYLNENVQSIY